MCPEATGTRSPASAARSTGTLRTAPHHPLHQQGQDVGQHDRGDVDEQLQGGTERLVARPVGGGDRGVGGGWNGGHRDQDIHQCAALAEVSDSIPATPPGNPITQDSASVRQMKSVCCSISCLTTASTPRPGAGAPPVWRRPTPRRRPARRRSRRRPRHRGRAAGPGQRWQPRGRHRTRSRHRAGDMASAGCVAWVTASFPVIASRTCSVTRFGAITRTEAGRPFTVPVAASYACPASRPSPSRPRSPGNVGVSGRGDLMVFIRLTQLPARQRGPGIRAWDAEVRFA